MPENGLTYEDLRPAVRAGERLGYANSLLEPRSRASSDEGTVTLPYLVVSADAKDEGERPLPVDRAFYNQSVQLLDASGNVVQQPVAGSKYTLRCVVHNNGLTAVVTGIAEFYMASAQQLDTAITAGPITLAPHAYVSFAVPPNSVTTVDCPRPWSPSNDVEAASSVLVQVYDPVADPVRKRLDPIVDRHVGRFDTLPLVDTVIVPYLATGYKYKIVPHDALAGFEKPGFDDSSFQIGDAGFGTTGLGHGCALNTSQYVKTSWLGLTDIVVRRAVILPLAAANLRVSAAIDDDIQVFINGYDISQGLQQHDGCATRDSFSFSAPVLVASGPGEQPELLLKPRTNLLAVRGRERVLTPEEQPTDSYLDIQVAALIRQ